MPWFSCFPFFQNFRHKKANKISSIPYQNFSLPFPIIRYLSTHGKFTIQLKLFSTCQLLKKFITKIRVFQVDKIEYNDSYGRPHNLSITDDTIVLKWNYYKWVKCLQPIKVKQIIVNLRCMDTDSSIIFKFLQNLDSSLLETAVIWMKDYEFKKNMDINVLKPIFVPSLTELFLGCLIKLENGDMLNIALTELPNLKKFEMRCQDGITNLSTAALIPRKTKLEIFDLNYIEVPLKPEIISNFVIHQMADSSLTDFYFTYRGGECACECRQKEINEQISKYLTAAEFRFNVLYVCSHP